MTGINYDATLTLAQALAAVEAAEDMIRGAEDQDELDQLSDVGTCHECLPEEFTEAQKDLAQQVVLGSYMRSIGRG